MTRQRESPSRRPERTRSPQSRILVLCGGQATEPTYFEGLRDQLASSGNAIVIKSCGEAPLRVLKEAVKVCDRDFHGFDQAWCVFDVDDFDLAPVAKAADRSGIRTAVSNPCFELWLLLHLGDCQSHLEGYPAVVKKLKKSLPDYDNTKLICEDFRPGVCDAILRAKRLGDGANPSTGVWRLVARIVEREE